MKAMININNETEAAETAMMT